MLARVFWLLTLVSASLCFGALPTAQASSAVQTKVRRFALVVGADDGGEGRARLRFASSDANALSGVLGDIGGVAKNDRYVLRDPDPEMLASSFAALAQVVATSQKAGQQTQVIFYYSGHSDEQGLLLGGSRIDYKTLRALIKSVPADVHVAILDSCASGAFTRLKGGTKRPAFLAPTGPRVQGHAYLTSSSADESSQESDKVGGSFFTHYFVTGLRGAADQDGDRQVTLAEAYQFAYDETLARTESTMGGAQHANYDINLAGSGDLMMTDLRVTSARLEIGKDVGGRIFARDSNGYLAAELSKAKGSAPVLLALEPDMYEITVADGDAIWKASLTVREGKRAVLSPTGLRVSTVEQTVLRGTETAGTGGEPGIVLPPFEEGRGGQLGPQPKDDDDEIPAEPDADGYITLPVNLGLFPPIDLNARAYGKKITNNLAVSILWSRAARVEGLQAAVGVSVAEDQLRGVQLSAFGNISRRHSYGFQGAFFWNSANQHQGVQAGLVNIGGQIRGVQLGLINTADEADASIGLITHTKKGGTFADVWSSDTAAIMAAVRFRAKYTYSFLAVGGHPVPQDSTFTYGFGFGGHAPLGKKTYLDIDTGIYGIHDELQGLGRRPPGFLNITRAMIGVRPAKRFAVFGGPTFNLLLDQNPEGDEQIGRPGYDYSWQVSQSSRNRLRIWPGFALGIEL